MSNGNKKPPVNLRGSAGGYENTLNNKQKLSKPNSITKTPKQQPPTHEQVKRIVQSRNSQADWMLKKLKREGHISTIEAYQNFVLSPSACIYSLKKRGHIIRTVQDYERMNGMATYHLIKLAEPNHFEVKP